MKKTDIYNHLDLGTIWRQGRNWRRGITTGTCAAAAAKAGALISMGKPIARAVEVRLPNGRFLSVPVAETELLAGGGMAIVIKDGGDDPDITHGLPIRARIWPRAQVEIEIIAGEGVGMVTKPGLSIPPGEPAINPIPRKMILDNVAAVLGPHQGALIEISALGGEEAAQKTMNPQLGIVGGISIIGTTGIVEPMSEEAFKESLLSRLNQIKVQGYSTLILVPGRSGEKAAIRNFGLPEDIIAPMSNFVGFMLEKAVELDFKNVLLLGHIGKLVKVASGSFHTHNRVSDGRLETMAAWLGALGAPSELIRKVLDQPTTEGVLALVREYGYQELFDLLAEKGEKRCQLYLRGQELQVGLVMTDLGGKLLGLGTRAAIIGSELEWRIGSK